MCVGRYPPPRPFRAGNVHSLWLRCPDARPGQWIRAGLPVAERVLSAEVRGGSTPSTPPSPTGISLSDSFICSLVLFLDYFRGEKQNTTTWRWMFGSRCFQLTVPQSAAETPQIDMFLHTLKKKKSYCLVFKGTLLILLVVMGAFLPETVRRVRAAQS